MASNIEMNKEHSLDSKFPKGSITLKYALRGVIYGAVSPELAGYEVDVFANGLCVGSVMPTPSVDPDSDELILVIRVPPAMILEDPVSIRARLRDGHATSTELYYETASDFDRAFRLADATVTVRCGEVVGTLVDVNYDALPFRVVATDGDRIIAKQTINRFGQASSEQLLPPIPFTLPLPADLLDGRSRSISIGIEDCPWQFEGSPIAISVFPAAEIARRLGELERSSSAIMAKLSSMQEEIVDKAARQFHTVIIPRVDAIVSLQRIAIERQLAAMWRELPGNGFERIGQKLPTTAVFQAGTPFIGFGWSQNYPNGTGGQWFGRSAHLALELTDQDDAIIILQGAALSSPEVLRSASVDVNGVRIKIHSIEQCKPDAWRLAGSIDRRILRPEGSLDFRIRTEITSLEPDVARPESVSLSVRRLTLVSAMAIRAAEDNLADAQCIVGFHGIEETESGQRFRWMSESAIVGVLINGGKEISRVRIAGPMVINPLAMQSLNVRGIGCRAMLASQGLDEYGWHIDIEIHDAMTSIVALDLSTVADHPRNGDSRLLSLAVSRIDHVDY